MLDLNGCVGMAETDPAKFQPHQTNAMQTRELANMKDIIGARQESLFSEVSL